MPRVKQHFKVHLSLGNHAKTAAMFSDNDLLATWTRLGMLAVERRAGLTSDIFVVRREELPALTGQKRGDSALRVWNKLLTSSPVVANYSAPIWTVEFPKFAEKQGFGLRKGAPPTSDYRLPIEEGPSDPLSPARNEAEAGSNPIQEIPTTPGGGNPTKSRGSAESADLDETLPSTRVLEVRRVWAEVAQAAAVYGKRWNPKPSKRTETAAAARLRDNPTSDGDCLVRAVHGAVKFWRGTEDPDRMIASFLRPQTIFQATKFDGYVEAYNQPDIPASQRSKGNGRDTDAKGIAERALKRLGLDDGAGEAPHHTIDITPDRDGRKT